MKIDSCCEILVIMGNGTSQPKAIYRTNNITKGNSDPWGYRGIILENEMKVLLISHPSIDKSAAALDVHIGTMADPLEALGMAHLCEHMLFTGRNDFKKFLSEHRGSSNAFTTYDHTNYYFDISPTSFLSALSMFADILRNPHFTRENLDSEINAIQQEFEKNKVNDLWRISQVEKLCMDQKHHFSLFHTGNRKTFEHPQKLKLDVFILLKDFYSNFYSSNIMTLTILSKESLDKMENISIELFSKFSNKKISVKEWTQHPLNVLNLPKIVYIDPLKKLRNIFLTFPIFDLDKYYHNGPSYYIRHVFAHKSPGSLHSILKNLDFINDIDIGYKTGAKGFAFYVVCFSLTEKGNFHTNEIIKLFFSYINMLKINGVIPWIYEQCREMASIKFHIKDLEHSRHCVTHLSECLHKYPMEDVLSAGYLLDEQANQKLIENLLNLFSVEFVLISIVTSLKDKNPINLASEKWYGTLHCIEDIKQEQIFENAIHIEKLTKQFKIPPKNIFIPSNFALKKNLLQVKNNVPVLIKEKEKIKLWFCQDSYYNLPKAVIYINLLSKFSQHDCESFGLINLLVCFIKICLTETLYSAELVDFHHYIEASKNGIVICVKGFNDKLTIVLHEVLNQFVNSLSNLNETNFTNIKSIYMQHLVNFHIDPPYKQCVFYTNFILSHKIWSKDEILSVVKGLSLQNLVQFIPNLFASFHFELLIHGNFDKTEAENICDSVLSYFEKSEPNFNKDFEPQKEFRLKCGKYFKYKRNLCSVHEASCIQIYYQIGRMQSDQNVLLQLLCQIISSPAYHQLRTIEKLCYIFQCELRRNNSMQGLKIILQGNHPTEYLHKRVLMFMNNFENILLNMSEGDFNTHKTSLMDHRKGHPKKLSEQSSRWWFEISTRQYQFNRDEEERMLIRDINKEDLINFYKTFFKPDGKLFSHLCVELSSTKFQSSDHLELIYEIDEIKSPTEFKQMLQN